MDEDALLDEALRYAAQDPKWLARPAFQQRYITVLAAAVQRLRAENELWKRASVDLSTNLDKETRLRASREAELEWFQKRAVLTEALLDARRAFAFGSDNDDIISATAALFDFDVENPMPKETSVRV